MQLQLRAMVPHEGMVMWDHPPPQIRALVQGHRSCTGCTRTKQPHAAAPAALLSLVTGAGTGSLGGPSALLATLGKKSVMRVWPSSFSSSLAHSALRPRSMASKTAAQTTCQNPKHTPRGGRSNHTSAQDGLRRPQAIP